MQLLIEKIEKLEKIDYEKCLIHRDANLIAKKSKYLDSDNYLVVFTSKHLNSHDGKDEPQDKTDQ